MSTGILRSKQVNRLTMKENDALVGLAAYVGFGSVRINLLRNYFGSAEAVWRASRSDLAEVGLSRNILVGFEKHRKGFNIKAYKCELVKLGAKVVVRGDENYPRNLLDIDSAPEVLYVLGNIDNSDSRAVAIVGTRKLSAYGREVAEDFAAGFGLAGVTVVSGFAPWIFSFFF